MAETLTLPDFEVGVHDVRELGIVEGHRSVFMELADAFDASPNSIPGVLGAVAPKPKLQENIEHGVAVLSDSKVQERIGYTGTDGEGNPWNAFTISHDLVERVGLQTPVTRPLMRPAQPDEHFGIFDAAILPDRVKNWMDRMVEQDVDVAMVNGIRRMILVPANRTITAAESSAAAGMPSSTYMSKVLVPKLAATSLFDSVEVLAPAPPRGEDVMAAAARHITETTRNWADVTVVMPTVAGNWVQAGAQAREALQIFIPEFDADPENRQLYVSSDPSLLGKTGEEPRTTHQNPVSALGNVLRSMVFFDRLRG